MTTSCPDEIADCVLNTFDSLAPKFKPRTLEDGRREWVPLAGIVLSKDDHLPTSLLAASSALNGTPARDTNQYARKKRKLECVALATGMRCLPRSKIEHSNGNVLHDWHAEVLAIRAFNRWLVDECADLARRGLKNETTEGEQWVRRRLDSVSQTEKGGVDKVTKKTEQPFELSEGVEIHMYCSEAPCGDASMELIMAAQEDATPWTRPQELDKNGEVQMAGRGYFNELGIVRRKPSRPDAPETWSKSCSDKLAMKQCTSLLSSVTTRLLQPGNVYLKTLILPEPQYVPQACERAFSSKGRMAPLTSSSVQERWKRDGYAFHPFTVTTTKREFAYSKRSLAAHSKHPFVPSNLSALYTPHQKEILINGVLQGRKQFSPLGASCVSRRSLWKAVLDIAVLAGLPALQALLVKGNYGSLKGSVDSAGRERVKEDVRSVALKGWKRNVGDENWGL